MRVAVEKILLVFMSLTLMSMVPSSVIDNGTMTVGLLLALICSGLVEWRGGISTHAWMICAAYVLGVLAFPQWCVFLPLVAYDSARLSWISRRAAGLGNARMGIVVGWLCLAPVFIWLARYRYGTAYRTVDAAIPKVSAVMPLLATVVLLGFALGVARAESSSSRRALRRVRDRARERSRHVRLRLSDVEEERARAVRMATLGERTRIAREIHDNVGHVLTRAIMQSQAGKVVADAMGNAAAAEGFTSLNATLNDAMTLVRRSVHDLEDNGTDFAAQIADAAGSFDGLSPDFAVTLTNDITSAPAPVSRCFATTIREALSNVIRHSHARTATVMLRDFPAIWQLVVLDPGPARNDDSSSVSETAMSDTDEGLRGMGLADIEVRVRALGGTSLCGPYRDGWRVFVSVPKAPWVRDSGGHESDHEQTSSPKET
ncbi:two-component sensor histidine kinase [Bifidobacterium callimiconis]|uniref:sensor histidine kinase n=1 Tax=Bifidobacterium callimiconis TaxID=2306973 RepID=UPI001BDC0974|nr:histidine kinase [Bifidobacterium callimiconis]MBT1176364.1 two-component sensor histidine kinase [Bifidobacterium callimiconis]